MMGWGVSKQYHLSLGNCPKSHRHTTEIHTPSGPSLLYIVLRVTRDCQLQHTPN
jgi:hypothetical protein